MCTRPLLGGEGPGNKARVHTAQRHAMQQIKCSSEICIEDGYEKQPRVEAVMLAFTYCE